MSNDTPSRLARQIAADMMAEDDSDFSLPGVGRRAAGLARDDSYDISISRSEYHSQDHSNAAIGKPKPHSHTSQQSPTVHSDTSSRLKHRDASHPRDPLSSNTNTINDKIALAPHSPARASHDFASEKSDAKDRFAANEGSTSVHRHTNNQQRYINRSISSFVSNESTDRAGSPPLTSTPHSSNPAIRSVLEVSGPDSRPAPLSMSRRTARQKSVTTWESARSDNESVQSSPSRVQSSQPVPGNEDDAERSAGGNATGTMHTSEIIPTFDINKARMAPSSSNYPFFTSDVLGVDGEQDMARPDVRGRAENTEHWAPRTWSFVAGRRVHAEQNSSQVNDDDSVPDLSPPGQDRLGAASSTSSSDGRSTPSNRDALPASSPYRRRGAALPAGAKGRDSSFASIIDDSDARNSSAGFTRQKSASRSAAPLWATRRRAIAESEGTVSDRDSEGEGNKDATATWHGEDDAGVAQAVPGSARSQTPEPVRVETEHAVDLATPQPTDAKHNWMREHVVKSLTATNPARERILRLNHRVLVSQSPGFGGNDSGTMLTPRARAGPSSKSDDLRALAHANSNAARAGANTTPLLARHSELARGSGKSDSYASSSSSHDLTVPAGRRGKRDGNASLPDLAGPTREGVSNQPPSHAHVDQAKLRILQQHVNEGLERENEELRAQLEQLGIEIDQNKRSLSRALRELEVERQRSDSRSRATSPLPDSETQSKLERLERLLEEEQVRADVFDREAGDLAEQLDELKGRLEHYEPPAQENVTGENQDRRPTYSELEDEIAELEDIFRQREEEVQNLYAEMEDKQAQHDQQLRDSKQDALDAVDRLESRLEAERDEAREAERRTRTLNLQLESRIGELTRQGKGQSALTAELERARQTLRQTEAELREKDRALEEQKSRDAVLVSSECATLRSALQKAERAAQTVRGEHSETLQAQRRAASDEAVARLKRENEQLRNKLAAAQASTSDETDESKTPCPSDRSPRSHRQDLEIQMLRSQKVDLKKRVVALSTQTASFSAAWQEMANASGLPGPPPGVTPDRSAALPKSVLNLRKDKDVLGSPGPLSEASWLNHDSTIGGHSIMNHLHVLREQLDRANAEIDEKLVSLDSRANEQLGLAERLECAKERIADLEHELLMTGQANGDPRKVTVALQRLRHIICNSCTSEFDATKQVLSSSHSDEATTRASASNLSMSHSAIERGRTYADVNEQLAHLKKTWLADMQDLKIERDRYKGQREDLSRENQALRQAGGARRERDRENAERINSAVQDELLRARQVTQDFQQELDADRARLHQLASESSSSSIRRDNLEARLKQTEQQLADVHENMREKEQRHAELNSELFRRSQISVGDVHAELLKLREEVASEAHQVGLLQQRRQDILDVREELNAQLLRAREKTANAFADLKAAREAMSAHQAQLDDQIRTIESLHAGLTQRNLELEEVAGDRDRLQQQRLQVLKDVRDLEHALRQVRIEAAGVGRDLEKYRLEQHLKSEGAQDHDAAGQYKRRIAEAELQVRSLSRKLEEELRSKAAHSCDASAESRDKHLAECRGLLVHVRYLKACYMREADLRSDLAHQKEYLVRLVGGLDMGDQATRQLIADVGLSRGTVAPPQLPLNRLRKVVLTVIASQRMRLMAERWAQTRQTKTALREVHALNKAGRDEAFERARRE